MKEQTIIPKWLYYIPKDNDELHSIIDGVLPRSGTEIKLYSYDNVGYNTIMNTVSKVVCIDTESIGDKMFTCKHDADSEWYTTVAEIKSESINIVHVPVSRSVKNRIYREHINELSDTVVMLVDLIISDKLDGTLCVRIERKVNRILDVLSYLGDDQLADAIAVCAVFEYTTSHGRHTMCDRVYANGVDIDMVLWECIGDNCYVPENIPDGFKSTCRKLFDFISERLPWAKQLRTAMYDIHNE